MGIHMFLCIGDRPSWGYICHTYPGEDKHSNLRDYSRYNMRTSVIIVFALVAAVCSAAEEPIAIVSQTQDGPNPDGSYKLAWESANGIKVEEEGSLAGTGEDAALQVKGSVSYKSDDGQDISLTYTANEEGFKPEGAHLPTPPPIPELIQKALDWIAANPSKEDQ